MNQERSLYINTGTLDQCPEVAQSPRSAEIDRIEELNAKDLGIAARVRTTLGLVALSLPKQQRDVLDQLGSDVQTLALHIGASRRTMFDAREHLARFQDQVGKLNAACEEREQEIKRLREQLAAKRKARRRSKVKA